MIFGKNKSLVCFKSNPQASHRLLCLPCAGSGASMYRRWADYFPELELWAVNYPGRESLHSLPFAESAGDILSLILENKDRISDKPMVIYGHSFGSVMGFLLARELQKLGVTVTGLCVSARRAPHLPASYELNDLSDEEFLGELDRLGGIPDAIRNDQEMLDFYMPVIKADLKLNDLIQLPESDVVDCPLYLYSATDDKAASSDELCAWNCSTTSRFEHKVFDGGHFFIQDSAESFLAHLRTVLSTLTQDEEDELIAF